jgi:ABC-type glycerol-3-phosphate transport system substrate-binding protein
MDMLAFPGIGGAARPFVNSWVWALASSDATNQQNSAELIDYLMTPENLGTWSTRPDICPPAAPLSIFGPRMTRIRTFVRTELERAEPFPLGSRSEIFTALENALFDVVSLSQTAQLAAEEAINEIQP